MKYMIYIYEIYDIYDVYDVFLYVYVRVSKEGSK